MQTALQSALAAAVPDMLSVQLRSVTAVSDHGSVSAASFAMATSHPPGTLPTQACRRCNCLVTVLCCLLAHGQPLPDNRKGQVRWGQHGDRCTTTFRRCAVQCCGAGAPTAAVRQAADCTTANSLQHQQCRCSGSPAAGALCCGACLRCLQCNTRYRHSLMLPNEEPGSQLQNHCCASCAVAAEG